MFLSYALYLLLLRHFVFLKSVYVYPLRQAYMCENVHLVESFSVNKQAINKQVLWYHEQNYSIRSSVVCLL